MDEHTTLKQEGDEQFIYAEQLIERIIQLLSDEAKERLKWYRALAGQRYSFELIDYHDDDFVTCATFTTLNLLARMPSTSLDYRGLEVQHFGFTRLGWAVVQRMVASK